MNASAVPRKLSDWEARWATYDEPTYQSVIQAIQPDDIVLDIGAGDLRLAYRMAAICRAVIAIEMQPALLRARAHSPARIRPDNLTVMVGDARLLEFPKDITTGVLLMRHCTHYQLYATKLKQAGARRLITNARWRMDVEVVDLLAPALPFVLARPGWFACDCGAIGFKCGPVEAIKPETMLATTQVRNCPTCDPHAVSPSYTNNPAENLGTIQPSSFDNVLNKKEKNN